MSGTDWESRYQSGDMPWEKGAPSPGLVDFLAAHPDLPRETVLVPGCGSGHDVRAWAQAGFAVTAYDIAPSAVQLTREGNLAAGVNAEVMRGDFLGDAPLRLFDWIFEHTLFCAIDPACRDAYCVAVRRWLKPRGHYLAVSYLIPDAEGPPFGTTRQEQLDRFLPDFELLDEWIPRSYPNRAGLERMFWWRKRA
jgi:SAM-dependent methyltransferase